MSNGQPVAVGWYLINQAAHLLDAVQDGNFVPDETISTAGKAVNLATSLIFIAFQSLSAVQQNDEMVTRIFSESGFKSTLGQNQAFNQDSANLTVEEALNRYWQATILKSGSLFRMATAGGAAAGTDNPRLIEAVGEYGTALGVILQILDDCRDALDRQTGEWEISLPVLLYSMARGEKEIVRPDTRAQLQESGVPQMISSILADWWQRALDSLAPLEPSFGRRCLKKYLPRDFEKLLHPKCSHEYHQKRISSHHNFSHQSLGASRLCPGYPVRFGCL